MVLGDWSVDPTVEEQDSEQKNPTNEPNGVLAGKIDEKILAGATSWPPCSFIVLQGGLCLRGADFLCALRGAGPPQKDRRIQQKAVWQLQQNGSQN